MIFSDYSLSPTPPPLFVFLKHTPLAQPNLPGIFKIFSTLRITFFSFPSLSSFMNLFGTIEAIQMSLFPLIHGILFPLEVVVLFSRAGTRM